VLACDFRVGTPDIQLSMPASRFGVHYYGGLRRCVTRLGLRPAERLFLTAERIDAQELKRIGYVDEIAPEGTLGKCVEPLAKALETNSPAPVKEMKSTLNRIARGEEDPTEIDRAWRASLRSSALHEGLAAHAENRPPSFKDACSDGWPAKRLG
jgi:enoyl-CoA hydratase/carnithine racemase